MIIKPSKKIKMYSLELIILMILLTSTAVMAEEIIDAGQDSPDNTQPTSTTTPPQTPTQTDNTQPQTALVIPDVEPTPKDTGLAKPVAQYVDTTTNLEKTYNDGFIIQLNQIPTVTNESNETTINQAMDSFTQVLSKLSKILEINDERIKQKKPEIKISEEVKKALETKYQMFVDLNRWREVPGIPKELRAGTPGNTGPLGWGGWTLLIIVFLVVVVGGGWGILARNTYHRWKKKFTGEILEAIEEIVKIIERWLHQSNKKLESVGNEMKKKRASLEDNEDLDAIITDLKTAVKHIEKDYVELKNVFGTAQFKRNFNFLLDNKNATIREKFERILSTDPKRVKKIAEMLISISEHKKLEQTLIGTRIRLIEGLNNTIIRLINEDIDSYNIAAVELNTLMGGKYAGKNPKGIGEIKIGEVLDKRLLYDILLMSNKIKGKTLDLATKNALRERLKTLSGEENKAIRTLDLTVKYLGRRREYADALLNCYTSRKKIEFIEKLKGHIKTEFKLKVHDSKVGEVINIDEIVSIIGIIEAGNKTLKEELAEEQEFFHKLVALNAEIDKDIALIKDEEGEIQKASKKAEQQLNSAGINTTTEPKDPRKHIIHAVENLGSTEIKQKQVVHSTIIRATKEVK